MPLIQHSKFLKYSSKRKAEYLKIKEEMAPGDPGFRTLCPTRWTVRANYSLVSVRNNYCVLQSSLDSFSDMASRDMEMSARVSGIASQLEKFEFLFGVMLGEKVLQFADNLSRTLQKKELSAAEGHAAASLTCDTLCKMRTDEAFKEFWEVVQIKAAEVGTNEPTILHKWKAPKRIEVGEGDAHFAATPEEHYRAVYFETFDLIIACIRDRFDQPGYRIYHNLGSYSLNVQVAYKRKMATGSNNFEKL